MVYKFSIKFNPQFDVDKVTMVRNYNEVKNYMQKEGKVFLAVSEDNKAVAVFTEKNEAVECTNYCDRRNSEYKETSDSAEVLRMIDKIISKRGAFEKKKYKEASNTVTETGQPKEVSSNVVDTVPPDKSDGMDNPQSGRKSLLNESFSNNDKPTFEEKRISELKKNPDNIAKKDANGNYIIAESRKGTKILVYGEGGKSDLTSGLHVYAQSGNKVGKSKNIPISNVKLGGNKLGTFMREFSNEFTETDIANASNRLWVLVMEGSIEMETLEENWDFESIYDYYIKRMDELMHEPDPTTVFVEAVNGRIDVGLYTNEAKPDMFELIWKEFEEKTDISRKAWLKQANGMKRLIPDPGRSGGQHTPSKQASQKYGKDESQRIQRFAVPEEKAKEWLDLRALQLTF